MNSLNTNALVNSIPVTMQAFDAHMLKFDDLRFDLASPTQKSEELSPAQKLKTLELGRRSWEENEYRSSRERLYALLTDCYKYYLTLKRSEDKKQRAQYAKALEEFCDARNHRFTKNSSPMHKIVKAVFGADRRRISAYAVTLNIALVSGPLGSDGKATAIDPGDLSSWIESQGGVEEVRKSGGKPAGNGVSGATVKEVTDEARSWVKSQAITQFKLDAAAVPSNTDDVDELFVFIVSATPMGEFELKAVVKNDTVTNAAVRAHYKATAEERSNAEAESDAAETASRSAAH